MFFHSRACREDFADLVRRNRDRVSGGVVHSFTGTAEEAEELVSMGAPRSGFAGVTSLGHVFFPAPSPSPSFSPFDASRGAREEGTAAR